MMSRIKHILFIWIIGTVLAGSLSGCGVVVRTTLRAYDRTEALFYPGRHGDLTAKEKKWAATAWKYFENNLNYGTGLVNSSNRYPSASMWNTADYIAALVSAHELKIIDRIEFDRRLSLLLQFLNRMSLFQGKLPNLLYNTQTGTMVDYQGKQGELGWSVRDVGRLMLWLKIVGARYPEFSEYCGRVILRWDFCSAIDSTGQLFSAFKQGDQVSLINDQRLGYEEYCSRGYQAWGFSTGFAQSFEPATTVSAYGVDLLTDARDARIGKIRSTITTLPYVLDGLEFDWEDYGSFCNRYTIVTDPRMKWQAKQVYQVQERRFSIDKVTTARSDHLLSNDPYFVFDAIYADGYFWNTITGAGGYQPQYALVNTAAVFGMWALWPSCYTDHLMLLIEALYDSKQGWYEGRAETTGGYEQTISIGTNAIVLESLLYKVTGPLYHSDHRMRYYDVQLLDQFKRGSNCFPMPDNDERE